MPPNIIFQYINKGHSASKELFNKKLQSKSINPLSNVMKVLVLLYIFLRFLVVCSVSEVCSVHRVLILIMFAPSLTGHWSGEDGYSAHFSTLTAQYLLPNFDRESGNDEETTSHWWIFWQILIWILSALCRWNCNEIDELFRNCDYMK